MRKPQERSASSSSVWREWTSRDDDSKWEEKPTWEQDDDNDFYSPYHYDASHGVDREDYYKEEYPDHEEHRYDDYAQGN